MGDGFPFSAPPPWNPLGEVVCFPYLLSDQMNSSSNLLTAAALTGIAVVMMSCGPRLSEAHQEKPINPMPEIWQSTTEDISTLEQSRASRKEWDRKAESRQTVHNTTELSATLARSGLSSRDRTEAARRFQDAEAVVHYGFEGNFHALVFFRSGTPFLVKKW